MNKSKIKSKTCVLASILLANHLHAVAPTVTNVVANFNEPGILDITYDLQDPDTGTLYVWFQPSFLLNGEPALDENNPPKAEWDIYARENPFMLVTGDVGEGITPGNSKKIRWKIPGWALAGTDIQSPTISVYAADSLEALWNVPPHERSLIPEQSQFKITTEHKARTHSAPSGMEYVRFSSAMLESPYSEWTGMDDTLYTVSPFFVDRADITVGKYNEVVNWASSQGYTLTEYGDDAPEPLDPALSVVSNWQTAIVWCNARSQKEGLTPVYYTDSSRTTPLRNPTGLKTISLSQCDFKVDGYRIPTPFELVTLDHSFLKGGNGTDSYNWFSETPDPLSLRPEDLYRNGPLRIDMDRKDPSAPETSFSSFLHNAADSSPLPTVLCGPVREQFETGKSITYSTHNPKAWPKARGNFSQMNMQSVLFFGEDQVYENEWDAPLGPLRCVRSIPEEAQKAPPSALLK